MELVGEPNPPYGWSSKCCSLMLVNFSVSLLDLQPNLLANT